MKPRDLIIRTGQVGVELGNGVSGYIHHDPVERRFTFQCTHGWAAGTNEPICSEDSDFLERSFLVGANVYA